MMLFPWKVDRVLSEDESKNTRERLAVKLYTCTDNKAEKGQGYSLCVEDGNLMFSIAQFDTLDIKLEEMFDRIMNSDVFQSRVEDVNSRQLEGKVPNKDKYFPLNEDSDLINLVKLYTGIGETIVHVRFAP
ncbi:hypothetical protein ACJIZ3_019733 [Penstemon smallii]|uniref:Uncharacterized protein n=1 Tax=Penstemon smallii TaxID=265156 RepID=A0ABD3T1Z2_9LAMI